jgi:hypothetical protein
MIRYVGDPFVNACMINAASCDDRHGFGSKGPWPALPGGGGLFEWPEV